MADDALHQVIMQKLTQRKEGIQRIQVGFSGLAGVILLVGLANIVVDNARKDRAGEEISADSVSGTIPVTGSAVKPAEPLVELGVTPASDSGSQPVVADLQPDPNLREPMDRPPPVSSTLPSSRPQQPSE